MTFMLQVHRVAAVVLVVTMALSHWCSLSEAQLNAVEAAALFDLCDRPGTDDLWANCGDSANACINAENWPGIDCDTTKTSIINMYADDGSPHIIVNRHNAHYQLNVYQISMLSKHSRRIASGVDREYGSAAAPVRIVD